MEWEQLWVWGCWGGGGGWEGVLKVEKGGEGKLAMISDIDDYQHDPDLTPNSKNPA